MFCCQCIKYVVLQQNMAVVSFISSAGTERDVHDGSVDVKSTY